MALVAVVVCLAVVALAEGKLGYQSPAAHLVLETVNACVALLLAFLVYGRFRRSTTWQDLLLLQGLVVLGTANALLSVTLVKGEVGAFGSWLPPTLRIVGTLLIAASALAPARQAWGSGWRHWALAPAVAGMLLLSALLYWRRGSLPDAVTAGELLVPQILTLAFFVVAAVAFTLQARSRDDVLLRWLGPACAVGAFARLNYLLFPPDSPDWLYSGDVLRTVSYLLLLIAAGREISRHWALQAEIAVVEDRRRLAREMHDGVLQELGYIRSEIATFDGPRGNLILAASDRALDEARQMLEALGRADDEPLGTVLRRAVEQLAQRYGVTLDLEVDESIVVDRPQRHALVRIAREAVLNAVRHGKADRVRIQLSRDGDGSRLRIIDDGPGFDPEQRHTGFGLISMRERAEALPGTFVLTTRPAEGTTVVVRW
ncbi:signal transduction histidine kinase [Kribbella aluminosa]|uniref:Signal transduction histidine kinase n=1 Tax=Kribbella aluminosa TaxID=416017 RepID=A0ABS4UG34_9ACTN|nr:ATP-binding protein [Kribbella aluminosa]MBP2350607.1 signal transduction histidine kinase [Kribbella aluminosa]